MRRREMKRSPVRTGSRKYKHMWEAGKGLGSPPLPELKGNWISSPNSHTLFPAVSSCDQTDPRGTQATVCHGREREGKDRDGKWEREKTEMESASKEKSLEPRNCWDANKFLYLSYIVVKYASRSQTLKQKKCQLPFPYKS